MAMALTGCTRPEKDIWLEAESMESLGGWVIDQQSMTQMGSPYIMAHGMGRKVEDATTHITLDKAGRYRMWVRTRDWTRKWGAEESAGQFKVAINGKQTKGIFGTEDAEWHWQDGGMVWLKRGVNSIALHDLTGFNGRCDAIYFAADRQEVPPTEGEALQSFRAEKNPQGEIIDAGEYDLIVVGGGIAGCCAAVSAARLGCKVALIHNRPVLGGNNSSEVRVGLSGLIMQQPYPNLGLLLDELGGVGHWTKYEATRDPDSPRSKQIMAILEQHPEKIQHNAGPKSNYEDEKKLQLILAESNISLFLSTHITQVKCENNKITEVIGEDISSGQRRVFHGDMFADCTGDGEVGYLAGADYRMGRESKAETGEHRAPEVGDQMVMGTSVQWYAEEQTVASEFPACPWAIEFNEQTYRPITRGDWDWETGLNRNQITEIEHIRDYALRAVYGNWDYLKNRSSMRDDYANHELQWVAYIGGKRESRRLLGDIILCEQDLLQSRKYDDASFTTTWGIDLHYPKKIEGFDGEPFQSYCESDEIKPYAVPYRCLYSRNIENLFMAGRNISVTHVALGTIRVMRTGGMMGEVVGMAASLCHKHSTSPRGVYQQHLGELKSLMQQGVGKAGF
ncbi:MAG: FAD-dependent oxidoreductase [Alistipes sp.]|nr:FAD-dependent oxidoreductase [Alistipes sp.]